MSMKTSVVIANGTFPTATAPLLGSVEAVFAQASELGYDAVSVTVNHPDDVDVEAILAAMGQYGVKVSGLATGRICGADGFSISSADEANRTEAVDRMLGHLEICKKVDAKLIIGTVRGRVAVAGDRNTYEKQFRKSMTVILEKAEQLGVKVMLEAMSELDGDTYQTVAEAGECVRSFHSPALQLQIDTMHIAYNKEDFASDLRTYGDLLGQVDISDPERMVPGGKLFDFPALIEVLKEVGFEGYLLSEFRAAPPENAAKVGLDYIKSLS